MFELSVVCCDKTIIARSYDAPAKFELHSESGLIIDPYEYGDEYAIFEGTLDTTYNVICTSGEHCEKSDNFTVTSISDEFKKRVKSKVKKSVHVLYENAIKYRLEVCFKDDGYNKFYADEKNKVKYTLKHVFAPDVIKTKKHIRENFRNLYYITNDLSPNEMICIANDLDDRDYIEWCSVTPIDFSPIHLTPENPNPSSIESPDHNARSATPNFDAQQGYLNDFLGMNVRRAWNESMARGFRSTTRYVEWGLNPNHEDLGNIRIASNSDANIDHGNASMGVIGAANNNFGITGIAHQGVAYHYGQWDFDGLVRDSLPGDIVGVALQFRMNSGVFMPVNINRGHWERFRTLVDRNCIVFHTAANGGVRLTGHPDFVDYGDNGTILVGACQANNGRRATFSNFGYSGLFANSWGDWSVTTTGYGTLFNGTPRPNRTYTATYSGTSAACPLTMGATAVIQGHVSRHTKFLNTWQYRELIRLFGFTQGTVDDIGWRPNTNWMLLNANIVF